MSWRYVTSTLAAAIPLGLIVGFLHTSLSFPSGLGACGIWSAGRASSDCIRLCSFHGSQDVWQDKLFFPVEESEDELEVR